MLRKSGKPRVRAAVWVGIRTLQSLKQLHAVMITDGSFRTEPSVPQELLYSAAICIPGARRYARKLFDAAPYKDLFMWNTIIRATAHGPTPLEAFSLYSRISVSPDGNTFSFLLKACSRLSAPLAGRQFHGRIVKAGVESARFVRNALINFHANCGDLGAADALFVGPARRDVVAWSAMVAGYARRSDLLIARKLFDEMPSKDLISWNVMITAYAKNGNMRSARELFDQVPNRDVVSWNAMISGYAKCGLYGDAMHLFEEMRSGGVRPDEVTLLALLSACADSGSLDMGQRFHSALLEMPGGPCQFHGNTLIDMYSKCGRIDLALDVFRGMRERDMSTWNAIIGGLAFHGRASECVGQFAQMLREGVRPNEITFVGVLSACSHAGMVEEGRKYFALMRDIYCVEPNVKHYGCMVDMLGRAGLLGEAFEVAEGMRLPPDEPADVVWRALLGACRLHGNVELGQLANLRLLALGRGASGDYVLLSNMYASAGKWDGAGKTREMMDNRGVPKEAGSSTVGGA